MRAHEILAQLTDIADNGYRTLRQNRAHSTRKLIGCFPMYIPEELIHAAGALPVGIFAGQRRLSLVDSRLQTFTCWPVRAALEWGLQGGMKFLDGVVFPDICDAVQVLSEVWRQEFPGQYSDFVIQPARVDTALARDYYAKELRRFRAGLEDFLGAEISDAALGESIGVYNRNRAMLRELNSLRRANPALVSARDFAAAVTASMLMPKDEHNALLSELLRELKATPAAADHKTRLALFGFLCDKPYPGVLELLDELGATVVVDDLWAGTRYNANDAPEGGDPLEALADKLMNGVPCSTKHRSDRWLGQYLIELVEQSGAKGVIVMPVKYCEPFGFDYPDVKDLLAERGVPHLLLELDEAQSLSQARTRIQAFLEMIGGS